MEAASVSGKGLYVHSGLVIRLDGIPLGTLERRTSCCQTREKESQRWINTLAGCYDHIPENIETIVVADRAADMYDLFVAERHSKLHLLVRAVQDRRMDHTALYLQKAVSEQVPVGEVQVEVGRRGELVPRQAVLAIRYLQVQILPPYRGVRRKGATPLSVWAILAPELTPPPGEEASCWWSLRLERALAVYSIVAWRLLWHTYQARLSESQSCTVVFEPHEWQSLCCIVLSSPSPPQQLFYTLLDPVDSWLALDRMDI